ncbi:SpoIIAA family protein [Phaeocystidibacter marisrubri]|uniref:STAS/SEC14 domain-containing protein n=1 Tax=Phaeocystidibacter marisrubri TaxID=1577780 RepID=A0A6L3ZFE1_9FLAO|nr:STAS/SEC14 domain-containing protein [Phaeocystidibacter marisrubri]KAB2816258.1 STAS/SEC14 domain-containing protein [Phaeocystidibacter marisrubri]GGH68104.1 hypothetical protein GCM10011318_07800 [Phaeocystidibacter marisrubri]
MIQIEENIDKIYMVATGKLDDTDYDKMLPLLWQKIEQHEQISWYFEMQDFEGWSASALWRDAKFDLKNKEHLKKVAIVGQKKWHELMTDIMKPFTDADIRYFDEEEAEAERGGLEPPVPIQR